MTVEDRGTFVFVIGEYKKFPIVGETTFPHHLVYNCFAALHTCKPPALKRYPPHPLTKERKKLLSERMS